MAFKFNPTDGLRNIAAFPPTPANQEAARNDVQTPMDQLRDYVNVYLNYAVADGVDNYTVTLDPAPEAYTEGMVIHFKASANTGASTLNVSNLGAKTIISSLGGELEEGDILDGQVVTVVYDGINFQYRGGGLSRDDFNLHLADADAHQGRLVPVGGAAGKGLAYGGSSGKAVWQDIDAKTWGGASFVVPHSSNVIGTAPGTRTHQGNPDNGNRKGDIWGIVVPFPGRYMVSVQARKAGSHPEHYGEFLGNFALYGYARYSGYYFFSFVVPHTQTAWATYCVEMDFPIPMYSLISLGGGSYDGGGSYAYTEFRNFRLLGITGARSLITFL